MYATTLSGHSAIIRVTFDAAPTDGVARLDLFKPGEPAWVEVATIVPSGGPDCPASPDLNHDGAVDGADLGLLLAGWGSCPRGTACAADLDGSQAVDGADLGLLLSAWTG